MSLGIILQARMGSTRLPGKVVMPVGARSVLQHIVFRMGRLTHQACFVIATTDLQQDDVIESFCSTNAIECFRGSGDDVLDRYYQCAKKYGFSNVVRITGDNPFVDVEELDRLIDLHHRNAADYSHSFNSLPVGSGSEIFTFNALEKSHLEGVKSNHREHVNEFIQENEHLFTISELSTDPQKKRSDIRLTVDTEEDYNKACFIVEHCSTDYVTTEEAIKLSERFSNGV